MPVSENDEVDFIEFLTVLWKQKYIVVLATFLFGIVSVYVALTETPIFRADVVIAKVNKSSMSGAASLASTFGSLGGLMGVSLGQDGPGRHAQAVLESRRLAGEFIVRYDLLSDLSPNDSGKPTMWHAIERFRELALAIREDATEGLTTVSISWADPETAARWANAYVALANEIIRTRAQAELERNIDYLNKQIEETDVVELKRVMYNLLQTETKTLMLANARIEYAFTVVDPAVVPEVRTSPRRTLIVLSGGTLGFFFGVFIVFVLNIYHQVRARELPGNA